VENIRVTPKGPDVSGYVDSAINNSKLVHDPGTIESFRQVAAIPNGMINLDISTLCNLKCHMCPYYGDQKLGHVDKHVMEYSDVLKVLDKTAAFIPGALISLTCRGELFCHPRAMDVIREIRRRGLRVCFITNGTLFGPDEIQEMIEIGIEEVRFSVDALLPETYEKIRGADKLQTVVSNIWEFLRQMKGLSAIANPKIYLLFVIQNLNIHEYLPFVGYWGDKVHEVMGNKWFTQTQSPLSISSLNKDFPNPARYLCMAPWRDLFIDSEGNAYPCCADSFVTMKLGSIKKQSLREIWLGEPYMRLRKEMLRGEFDEFKQCEQCRNWNVGSKRSYETHNGGLFLCEEYLGYYKYRFLKKFPEQAFNYEEYLFEARKIIKEFGGSRDKRE
jgi:radical SAM protein with 4Fe4S-binding SPASM domain